jgi:hypothetical protein
MADKTPERTPAIAGICTWLHQLLHRFPKMLLKKSEIHEQANIRPDYLSTFPDRPANGKTLYDFPTFPNWDHLKFFRFFSKGSRKRRNLLRGEPHENPGFLVHKRVKFLPAKLQEHFFSWKIRKSLKINHLQLNFSISKTRNSKPMSSPGNPCG